MVRTTEVPYLPFNSGKKEPGINQRESEAPSSKLRDILRCFYEKSREGKIYGCSNKGFLIVAMVYFGNL